MQSIEQTVKVASANEADVTDFYGIVQSPWIWIPYGMSMVRVPKAKLFTENVTVTHEHEQQERGSGCVTSTRILG